MPPRPGGGAAYPLVVQRRAGLVQLQARASIAWFRASAARIVFEPPEPRLDLSARAIFAADKAAIAELLDQPQQVFVVDLALVRLGA